MARTKSAAKRRRLHVELSPQVSRKLNGLLSRTGARSVSEVIDRAICLYDSLAANCSETGLIVVGGKEVILV